MRDLKVPYSTETPILTELGEAIVKTLAYSEVFKYPLNIKEIISSAEIRINNHNDIKSTLQELKESGIIYSDDGFYFLVKRSNTLERRKELNERANAYLKKAYRISRLIGNFPYVRAVFLSGSISKNCMEKDGDIDYFIITEEGRLWLSRSILIAFKKLLLFNSYKYFCLNYFIDNQNLRVDDHNIYVAHEIKSLIPTYGKSNCDSFFSANDWVVDFLPNRGVSVRHDIKENKIRGVKWILEKLFNNSFGNLLESKLKTITESHWKEKYQDHNQGNKPIRFVTNENISALHPENFKFKILDRYAEILSKQESRLNHKF